MRVVTLGETMGLATSITPGAIAHSRDFHISFGGSESNVAVGLARQGIDVTWVSRLGDDSLGEFIRRELRAENIAVVAPADPDAHTGFMIKERRTSDTATVSYYRNNSAASKLRPSDISDDLLRDADLLHLTGITLGLSSSAAETVADTARRATQFGTPVSFDLNYRSRLWDRRSAKKEYEKILPFCDIVFAGDDEASLVVDGNSPRELAEALINLGVGDVIIKLGAHGSEAVVGGVHYAQQAIPVQAVDTVGAGDAFVAGYLAATLRQDPAIERLRSAAIAGAMACTVAGDWEGNPHSRDLLAFGAAENITR
jgi:2-dehydro-3-deoxygluconokinase